MEASEPKAASALTAKVKEEAQRAGFTLVGISRVEVPLHEQSFAAWLRKGLGGEMGYLERTEALRRDPKKVVPWAVSVISVGMNYYQSLPRPAPGSETRGWISRYAWGDDYHGLLRAKLEQLLARIRNMVSEPLEGRAFVDSGPVLERDLAAATGMGWIGKNTHVISPRHGSWFFLGELFLSIELAYDRPIADRCGRCDLCLKACPTGAFVGPYVLDARRCISYLTIELKGAIPHHLRPLVGNHIFGCDICQEVCPYNVKADASSESAFLPHAGLYAPQLTTFFSLTEEEFRRRFQGSPILRAKRRGFLRNVAVALGNLKNRAAVPALIKALQDDDALVRRHVAWALGRIGSEESLDALQKRLQIESDAEVQDEIHAALKDEAR